MNASNGTSDTQPQLAAVLPGLQEERRQALEGLAEAQERLRLLDLAIEGITGLIPRSHVEDVEANVNRNGVIRVQGESTEIYSVKPKLTAMEAIAQAIRSSATGLTLSELTEAVAHLGFRPQSDQPDRAVRASANRLRDRDHNYGFVQKRYVYLPHHRLSPGEPLQAMGEDQ